MVKITALMYDETLDLIYEVLTVDLEWVRLIEDTCGDTFIGVL